MSDKMLVNNFINNTKAVLPDYWKKTLTQRLKGNSAGGYYDVSSIERLEQALKEVDWKETTHPDVREGCRVFVADLPGHFGLVNISELPDDIELFCLDPKGTGNIGIGVKADVCEAPLVWKTYLIVGKDNENDVVFTFHPGEPVRPSIVSALRYPHETKISKKDAMNLGFDLAKIF